MIAVLDRAVDEVLLAQRHQLPGLPERLSLQSSGGRESPARSTLTLVLDVGDRALGPPVESLGEAEVLRSDEGGGLEFLGLLEKSLAVAVLGADHLIVELEAEFVKRFFSFVVDKAPK